MRDILFRAKRINNGEWVEGYYVFFESMKNHCIYYTCKGLPLVTDIDPETVCQYTGLTDKAGNKIFEGDIVKYGYSSHKVVFENRFNTAYFGLVFEDRGEVWSFGHMCSPLDMTVIGNIFDNREENKNQTGHGGKMNGIVVGRHIDGITLNPLEYLLDEDGEKIIFASEDAAKEYLAEKGVTEEEMYWMVFEEVIL